eukprot:7024407-Pyramimonas_sp.AAC.1
MPAKFVLLLEQTRGKLLRALAKRDTSWDMEVGSVRCRTTQFVFRSWRIPRCSRQLLARRMRSAMRWARCPPGPPG